MLFPPDHDRDRLIDRLALQTGSQFLPLTCRGGGIHPPSNFRTATSFQAVNIPIYLLILTCLATLLLIWLVLVNRLARQEIQKSYYNPDTSIPR